MKTYLGENPDKSDTWEFLSLGEGGEVYHCEVLQSIFENFDNNKVLTNVKSTLKEEQKQLSQCINMVKSLPSA